MNSGHNYHSISMNQLMPRNNFIEKVRKWSDNAATTKSPDWEDQVRILSEVGNLITPELSLEQVIEVTYTSVNQLMDAYQFSVGLFDEEEMTITFKGIIENGQRVPDLIVDAATPNRLAPWCVLHGEEIFINDMEIEYSKYVASLPRASVGINPNASLYVPLRQQDKIAGLITVRTIRKNVYKKHHLYILRTLGTFIIRSLELAKEKGKPAVKNEEGGKKWRWAELNQLPLKSVKILDRLTEREKNVLFLMISGLPNKQIADQLFISAGTVKTHTLNIYQKLDVNNRTSAIMKALELNWFS